MKASDARVGMVILDEEGELCLIESRALCPPAATLSLMVDFQLRVLESGAVRAVRVRADAVFEAIELPQRALEYMYRTDTEHVLLDPLTLEEIRVPHWIGAETLSFVRPNERVQAGVWRGCPVVCRIERTLPQDRKD